MCRGRGSGARVQVQREGGKEGKRREEKLSRAWHTWHGLALAVTCKALALHESVVTELMTSTAAGPWLLNLYQLIAFALKATGASAAAEGGMQDRAPCSLGLFRGRPGSLSISRALGRKDCVMHSEAFPSRCSAAPWSLRKVK